MSEGMRKSAAIAKAGMQRRDRSLAEIVSGSQQTLCSRDLETEVCEIRGSDNWIHRIALKCRHTRSQQSEDYGAEADSPCIQPEPQLNEVQATCMVAQSLDLQCCSVPVDECEPGSDSSSAEQDAIPLINRFGSRESRESLYPTASFHSDELHMVAPQKQSLNQRIKLGMLVLAHAAIIGYLIALWQLLRNHISKPFAWHPVLMSVSLVLATESVIVMQFAVWPVPNGHTRPSRIFHYAAHTGSGIMQIIGIAQCVARRSESMGLASTGPTTHAIVGMLAALAFILQMAFGVYVAGIAPMLGRQKQGKQLYKYHRALGYVVLSLQWASAWLGVHSRWLQSKDAPGEWVWFFCFAALVVGILVPVDMSKFGFRQPA